ncbi:MAG: RelA/SpoT AH/RIS domain-containing protein [Evtepia gabavorous]
MLTAEHMLPHILEKVRFNSLEEMYAAIGYGGASAQKCANRAREELVHQDRQQAERLAAERAEKEAEEKAEAPSALDAGVARAGNKKRSVSGVIVSGMTECMVKFAKCCTPVPGDPIVGFITRGYGCRSTGRTVPTLWPAPSVPGRRTAGSRSAGTRTASTPIRPPWTSLPRTVPAWPWM